MLSISKHYLFAFMLVLSTFLSAETSKIKSPLDTESQRINLREAISKTIEGNLGLKSFRYQLKAQRGLVLQAGMAASPEVGFAIEDALGTGGFSGTRNAQLTLNIAWVVEGDIRQRFVDEARAGTDSISTEINIKRLDVAAETARLYLISLANQARLINAKENLKLANETVTAVNKRVKAGKSPDAELARAKADLARKSIEYDDLERKLISSRHLLAAQWGETEPNFTLVDGDIFVLPVTLSLQTLKKRLEQSPDFLRLLSDKRLRQAQLKLAKSQSSPEWKVNVGIRHYTGTDDQALVAGVAIPFGERSRNSGNIIAARENLLQSQALQDELMVRIKTTLFVLFQELQRSLHRADVYQNQIIPRLEKALIQTRRAYDLGRYSYLEWRSVQAELLSARTSLVEDSIAAHLKVIEIERLTGMTMLKPEGEKQ